MPIDVFRFVRQRVAAPIQGRNVACPALLFLFGMLFQLSTAGADVHPAPKRVDFGTDHVLVDRIVLRDNAKIAQRYPLAVHRLQKDMHSGKGGQNILKVEIELRDSARGLPIEAQGVLSKPQSYWLHIAKSGVRIVGSDVMGALYGALTLEQLVRLSPGRLALGSVQDWPDHQTRAVHLVLRGPGIEFYKELIDRASRRKFNTLILEVSNGVQFRSYPDIARRDAVSLDDFRALVLYAREKGMDVIPELALLTHQEKLLKDRYPALMFNSVTYDPRKSGVYEIVFALLDEIINTINPHAIHIGHDEMAGLKKWTRMKWLRGDEPALPPDLFLADVVEIRNFLRSRSVGTWMWGDMLLDPMEFKTMFHGALNGTNGYSKLYERLPRDIVICDWHYRDTQPEFPSSRRFAESGYRVLGATWKQNDAIKNFSKYMMTLPKGGEGMIATTWYHVFKQERELLNGIIDTSSEAFWNAK